MHSYRNPLHERQAAERIRQIAPELEVATSAELWPQMREYERTVMAVANLYIKPNVHHYFRTLKERLALEGISAQPFITQSNGGLMDIESAAEAPVKTLFPDRQQGSSVPSERRKPPKRRISSHLMSEELARIFRLLKKGSRLLHSQIKSLDFRLRFRL